MQRPTESVIVAVGALAEAFRQKATEATFRAYQIGLGDLTPEAIEAATAKAIRSCKFMPTVRELRELAGEITHADRAMLAWGVFADAVQGLGYYKSPDFDDPVMNATTRNLGGWMRACEQEGEEFDKWYRQQWVKTYEALSRRGVLGDEQSAPLVGYVQHENGRLGFDRRETVQIPTGLPWAGESRKRLKRKAVDVPRVEFQKP